MVRTAKKIKSFPHKKISNVLARKKMSFSQSFSKSASESPQRTPLPTPHRKMFSKMNVTSSTPLNKSRNESSNRVRSVKEKSNTSKRRRRSGVVALREIRQFQKTTNLLIPKLSFMRLVQEILQSYSTEPYRLQSQALEALQEMTEILMIDLFSEAVLCCLHAKRQTIMVQDMRLARRIRGREDVIN